MSIIVPLKTLPLNTLLFACFLCTALFTGCDEKHNRPQDTPTSGTIDISADQSFKEVIEEQVHVFTSTYSDAHINPHYKTEDDCFKDLFTNKARVILVTRKLTPAEDQYCTQKQIATESLDMAKDAIAIIVNKESPDTLMSISELKGILTGVYKKKYKVVFDNEGSSTLRYILDSLIPGQKLDTTNVFAAKSNDELIKYVSNTPGSIGLLGVSNIIDPSDTENETFIKSIKVVSFFNDNDKSYYKPYQAYIATKDYPFTRTLYFISRESWQGLGTGFVNFLCKERGQLIFKHAMLFPTRVSIILRETNLNTTSP